MIYVINMVNQEVANGASAVSGTFSDPAGYVEVLKTGLMNGIGDFAQALPGMVLGLIAAIVILLVGWLIAKAVAEVVRRVLDAVKLESFLAVHKVEESLGKVRLTDVAVQVVKYYVLLVFVQVAVAFLEFGTLTTYLGGLIGFAPVAIGASLVVVLSAIAGEFIKQKILEVHDKETYMRAIAKGAKYVVLFTGVMVGLDTLGFQTAIVQQTFLSLLQAVGYAFALAVGLAFGFGGQDAAKDWIDHWKKRMHL